MNIPKLEIECPSCNHAFALDEIYSEKIGERFQKEFESKNQDLIRKQKQLIEQEVQLQKSKQDLDDEIKKRLISEREQLTKQVQEKAKEEFALELKDKEQQLLQNKQKLEEANKRELEYRQRMREVEEKEKQIDLELQRRLDEQSKKYESNIRDKYVEALKMERQKYDLEKESLNKKVEELSRKLEQGSQQTQGEVMELVLEEDLKSLFPLDEIRAVPKGVNGADVVQLVNNKHSQMCGQIIWEFKNTKNFSEAWIQKLKDDQRSLKADVAILISQTFPKNIKGFGFYDGIWISDLQSYASLCSVLRMNLHQLYNVRQANLGKNEKMENLYQYFSGNQFKQRVQSITEAFLSMKNDLEKEKLAIQKIWAKREKELERVLQGTSAMQGDFEGILGEAMPTIENLELAALVEGSEDTP